MQTRHLAVLAGLGPVLGAFALVTALPGIFDSGGPPDLFHRTDNGNDGDIQVFSARSCGDGGGSGSSPATILDHGGSSASSRSSPTMRMADHDQGSAIIDGGSGMHLCDTDDSSGGGAHDSTGRQHTLLA